MGSVLRYLVAGLALSAVWLLVALKAVPGGLREVEEFSLFGWPAIGLLFLVPLALIWCALGVIRLQRRMTRLQALIIDHGIRPAQPPGDPRRPARECDRGAAEPPRVETWSEEVEARPASAQEPRAPKRVSFSALDPLPSEPEPSPGAAAAPVRAGAAAVPHPPLDGQPPASEAPAPAPAAAAGRPPRAELPALDEEAPDTRPEPLPDELEPHRPPRAHPRAPRLEALSPSYRNNSEIPSRPLPPEQFEQYEARTRRELNAVAMDLASIVSAPTDYDRALAALNGGAEDAFFQLLARDFQSAEQARLRERLAMVGGESMLDTYLEKYEQLLVVAYRSEPGGQSVKRLVDSATGRLHQAIESHRQSYRRTAGG